MNNYNNKKMVLIIVSILILSGSLFFIFYKKISFLNFFKKDNLPVYSIDERSLDQIKSKLVPAGFPFLEGDVKSEEFKRTLNSLDEYTDLWESEFTFEKNRDLYIKYMNDNGWNPFVTMTSSDLLNISAEKNGIVLNIFIEKLSSATSKVQLHFSQKNKI